MDSGKNSKQDKTKISLNNNEILLELSMKEKNEL